MDELTQVCVEQYRRGRYDKIPIAELPDGSNAYLTNKQLRAVQLLNDTTTRMIGYGGSARSGKTLLECFVVLMDCLAYPGVAWGLGRKELTVLKKTVIRTLNIMLKYYGLVEKIDYKHDRKENIITFTNGSEIFLIDTAFAPSDPLYTRYHGLELTRCAVDESNETTYEAIGILFSRTGWRMNEKYGLKRKLLETFNPDHTHVFGRFWEPFDQNREPVAKKFIQALPSDNPHPAVTEWIEDLMTEGDKIRIERLIHGNFNYSEDPTDLCNFQAISDIFSNYHVKETDERHISGDLAMQGRDKFVAGLWKGMVCEIAIDEDISRGREIELTLKELKLMNGVPDENLVADSDGLGAYLESYVENMYEFHGGGKALNDEEFGNLKDECGFKLAEYINKREILIKCTSEQEEKIRKELATCLKRENINVDKKRIIPKKLQKEKLGNSPDYYDMLMMKMVYHIVNEAINEYYDTIEIS